MIKKYISWLGIVTALTVLSSSKVSADIPPMLTMEFNIIYEATDKIRLIDGEQFGCKDKLCVEVYPLGKDVQKRFRCFENLCSSQTYKYLPYQKLILNFSDKTRESNIFSTELIDSVFEVRVTDDHLIVKKNALTIQRENPQLFVVALLLTLALELLISLIYISVKKISTRVLTTVIVANIISLPLVWFLFPQLILPALVIVLMSEIFAVIFEAYFVYFFNKHEISLGQSTLLSLMNNLVSLLIGGYIYQYLGHGIF